MPVERQIRHIAGMEFYLDNRCAAGSGLVGSGHTGRPLHPLATPHTNGCKPGANAGRTTALEPLCVPVLVPISCRETAAQSRFVRSPNLYRYAAEPLTFSRRKMVGDSRLLDTQDRTCRKTPGSFQKPDRRFRQRPEANARFAALQALA